MIQILTLWVKRLLLLLWGLFILVLSAKITLDNPEQTTLRLLGAEFSASNGFLFMVSLAGGMLLGISAVLPALYLAKRKCQRSERREAVIKKQLSDINKPAL